MYRHQGRVHFERNRLRWISIVRVKLLFDSSFDFTKTLFFTIVMQIYLLDSLKLAVADDITVNLVKAALAFWYTAVKFAI